MPEAPGNSRTRVAVLVPAYKPGFRFIELINALGHAGLAAVVVVNDGSGHAYDRQFQDVAALPSVIILDHAVNLGKGAALKTGLNWLACNLDLIGVVTADADGQHAVDDILRVADALQDNPEALILGVRTFTQNVPFRSKFGNFISRLALRALVGANLTDTQTGLRGIPMRALSAFLRLPGSGYEFELEMLIASRHRHVGIVQIPIETIYLDGNQESHFNPITDSMRIYFVLLRFSFISLCTTLIDNALFLGTFFLTANILVSQIAGRSAALIFNYFAARKAVFLSREPHALVFPKYLTLVIANGAVSYALIRWLHDTTGIGVVKAKWAAEGLLFVANFCIQRDFIFRRGMAPANSVPLDDTVSKPTHNSVVKQVRGAASVLKELIGRSQH